MAPKKHHLLAFFRLLYKLVRGNAGRDDIIKLLRQFCGALKRIAERMSDEQLRELVNVIRAFLHICADVLQYAPAKNSKLRAEIRAMHNRAIDLRFDQEK